MLALFFLALKSNGTELVRKILSAKLPFRGYKSKVKQRNSIFRKFVTLLDENIFKSKLDFYSVNCNDRKLQSRRKHASSAKIAMG